jgi:two-component system, chemotaxis family, chemotaxis protein CheY
MNLDEFLSEFQLEAGEKLDLMSSQLLLLEHDSTSLQPVREMFLAAHTIKGGAAMLRLVDVEALAHRLEELLTALRDQQRTLDGPTADLLFQSIDRLRDAVARAAPGAQPLAGDSGRAPSLPKALLVDDSPTVRELHRMLLEDAGFEVEVCEDGQVALSRARAGAFDVVVAGLQSKGLAGVDLILALRTNPAYRAVPIILTTADADPDLSRRASECGAHALVPKGSLQDERLSNVLRELGARRAA